MINNACPPTPNNLHISWKRVRIESRFDPKAVLLEKQDEETNRLKKLRENEPKAYEQYINEIVTFRSISRSLNPKFRFTVPKEFFEKRFTGKDQDKGQDTHTSLEVGLPPDPDDPISRQTKLRRSMMFKKHLRLNDYDYTTLPFLEEDALDLMSLLEMSTKRTFMFHKRGKVTSRLSDSTKLPYMKEINDKPKAGVLVSCFVKDHLLKLPLLVPNAERIKELYKHCIIKDEHLGRLFINRRDILPKDLQDYIKDFGAGNDVDSAPPIVKDEMTDRDQFFHTSMNLHCNDILREIETDSLEFSVFIKPCYILYFSQVMPDYYLIQIHNDPAQVTTYLDKQIQALTKDLNNPIGASRKQIMSIFLVANYQSNIRNVFMDLVNPCLENVVRGLFSAHSPVREESCYSLAYLFIQSRLIMDILNVYFSDFVYELIAIIFKAIDNFESTFEFYYSLIGYIMDGCPIIVILQCICEKGPLSKNYLMRKRWPKFIVFACKHWPNETFKGCQNVLKKIIDLLEKSYNNKITYKASRMALAFIGRRFDRKTMLSTYWVLNRCGPQEE